MIANHNIVPGFGLRLKEERLRLALSQAELAERAGIKRLTQAQYENEVTHPSIPYLSKVVDAGVDLTYLLFGTRGSVRTVNEFDERQIERQAFLLIEEIVAARSHEAFSPEDRHLLFLVIRDRLRAFMLQGQASEEPLLPNSAFK